LSHIEKRIKKKLYWTAVTVDNNFLSIKHPLFPVGIQVSNAIIHILVNKTPIVSTITSISMCNTESSSTGGNGEARYGSGES
jgi:hypothetical protein